MESHPGAGRRRWWRPLLFLFVALALALVACGGDDDNDEDEEPPRPEGAERIELTASDGPTIVADVWRGNGEWVLMGHQFPNQRKLWDPLVERVHDLGYSVLTWDFRCHGESECNTEATEEETQKGVAVQNIWRDWHAAIDYAVEEGATRIVGVGASMGGTSAVQVAAERPELGALAIVSSPNRFKGLDALDHYDQVTVPKLFIVGDDDLAAPDFSQRFYDRATGPAALLVLETDLHGNFLVLDEKLGRRVQDLILDFIQDPLGTVERVGLTDEGIEEPEPEEEQAEDGQTQGQGAAQEQLAQPPQDEDPEERPVAAEPAGPSQDITLMTSDGLPLSARVRSGAAVWVLLGHQFGEDLGAWDPLADELADDGYSVLRWDFRGHGGSPRGEVADIGEDWRAALDYAAAQGAKGIYVVGASMGGTAALQVAAEDTRIAGVVTLSAPAAFQGLDATNAVPEIQAPVLLIAGDADGAAAAAAEGFAAAAPNGAAAVFETDLHGNALVASNDFRPEIAALLDQFLPPLNGTTGGTRTTQD